jgi:hypothetical protein
MQSYRRGRGELDRRHHHRHGCRSQSRGHPVAGPTPSQHPIGLRHIPVQNIVQACSRGVRIAYVSGWAALDNARARSGPEALIPFSDHADFGELLQLVERSKAKRVDVVHGSTDAFARILQGCGIDAHAGQVALERKDGE